MLHLPTTVTAVRAALDDGDHTALSDLMEFDSPITVHEDGTITSGPEGRDGWAPSLWDGELDTDRWSLIDGYSGQDSYAGPVMHDSEFIGGRMARDILSEPGTYVAIASYYLPAQLDADDIPADFPVTPLHPGDPQANATDGTCGLSWDDSIPTEYTPAPSARCPFEAFHNDEDTSIEGWAVARLAV